MMIEDLTRHLTRTDYEWYYGGTHTSSFELKLQITGLKLNGGLKPHLRDHLRETMANASVFYVLSVEAYALEQVKRKTLSQTKRFERFTIFCFRRTHQSIQHLWWDQFPGHVSNRLY
ncbi:hypothetical protein L914_14260 [Phytophthora nicotianae]|uniref:Uncharacterized protein n=1 Tax=Phytophthora nicotianae TaxID=4792 RepID=W2MT89_PHYNI|nr:hypothetical protein L914_14260 [Phytophthora nicotianae]